MTGRLRMPWSRQAWVDTCQVLAGLPVSIVASTVVIGLASSVLALAITAVLAVPFLAALFWCSRTFSSWQRSRVRGFVDRPLPPIEDPRAGSGWLRRLWAETRAGSSWRQVAYHSLSALTSPLLSAVVIGFWTYGVMLTALPAYAWTLPARTFFAIPLHDPWVVALLTAIGVAMVFVAPWVADRAASLDAAMVRAMLCPSRAEELARQVIALSERRANAVDAADLERRRIERDLHDGAQQRLVSLAMNLGAARATLTDVPEEARAAIEQAHEEAKTALTELRNVVRGLHPAILDDLGLDAALSGIAAHSPVPVRLLVDLPRRPPRAIEAVAYFVISEALSNVAKHAHATRVDIVVEPVEDRLLRIIVSDNGRGGADPSRGSGLSGLRQRVWSVDGSLTIDSPAGGPTLLVVELPLTP